jgi:hypothetical protein
MFIHLRLILGVLLGWAVFGSTDLLRAAAFQEPRFTQVTRDVTTAEANSSPVPASVNSILRDAVVHTGPDSRAEITLYDRTVVRLGDNTALGVVSKDRTFDLTTGAILTQVPRGVGGTEVKAGAISATVTGTSLLVEFLPDAYIKFILLDGTSRVSLKSPGRPVDRILLRAGQMLIVSPKAKGLPEPADIDLEHLLQTCQLLTEFSQLPRQDLVTKSAAKQRRNKKHGAFANTNLVIFGRGTLVSQIDSKDQKAKPDQTAVSTRAAPSPDAKAKPSP